MQEPRSRKYLKDMRRLSSKNPRGLSTNRVYLVDAVLAFSTRSTHVSLQKLQFYENIWQLSVKRMILCPHQRLSRKPLEVRMGAGKGNPTLWVSSLQIGQGISVFSKANKEMFAYLKTTSQKLGLPIQWIARKTPENLNFGVIVK